MISFRHRPLKDIKIIFLIWLAVPVNVILFNLIYYTIFPAQERPIDEVVKDLETTFRKNKRKYEKTINIIEQIEDTCAIDIIDDISGKHPPFRLFYKKDAARLEPINYKYRSFDTKMSTIWRDIPFSGSFNKKFVTFRFHGNHTGANMLYTKISKEDFISHFVDSMEYCVYPEIPNNTKHWIVKLEDNWYLYDASSYFELE
ncbi:MAG: hypothetical protein IKO56_07075 [Alphaproteobacteria bacterium]|nr:hypothetical protein [Alphaproteobacteria bacterium]